MYANDLKQRWVKQFKTTIIQIKRLGANFTCGKKPKHLRPIIGGRKKLIYIIRSVLLISKILLKNSGWWKRNIMVSSLGKNLQAGKIGEYEKTDNKY